MIRSLGNTVAILLVIAVAACGHSLQSNFSFNFVGGGARAEAMGNAYFALSDDITAGAWNPAGLVIHEGPMLGASFSNMTPRGYTEAMVQSKLWRYDHAGTMRSISGMNFLAPIRIKGHPFVGSVNYTKNFEDFSGMDWGSEFFELLPVYQYNMFDTVSLHINEDSKSRWEGALSSITFSFGTRIYKDVVFGLGLNIYTGKVIREGHTAYTIDNYPIMSQSVLVVEDRYLVDTNKFSGTNFTIGFKMTKDKLSAGLVVRTPFDLKYMMGRSSYVVTYLNGLPTDVGSDTTFFDNILTKYEMPLMVGFGLAYNVKENFILSTDVEYKDFSNTMVKERDSVRIDPSGNNEDYFTEIDPEWNSVFSMRFGGEYLIDSKIGTIPLRAGLGFIPIPSPNQSETKYPVSSYNFPHMVFMPLLKLFNNENTPIRYTVSIGSGLRWSQIFLEWAYTYSTLGRDYEEDFSESKIRNHHVGFTFTGYF